MALLQEAYGTPEHKEAVAAFLDKRQPDYRGARARAAGEG
jgi:1,4-dihydroxy-2-naphthoyl-CoA synthase